LLCHSMLCRHSCPDSLGVSCIMCIAGVIAGDLAAVSGVALRCLLQRAVTVGLQANVLALTQKLSSNALWTCR
jgi:hypothetical protein